MDKFIRSQNVKRYRRLLERVTENQTGNRYHLLAEEQQKQKDAGDPVW